MLTSPRVFLCLMIGVPMLGLAGCGRDPEPAAAPEAVAADVPVPEVVAPLAPEAPDMEDHSAGGEAHVHGAGEFAVAVDGDMAKPTLRIRSTGQAARVPEETAKFLGGRDPDRFLDARAAQPYFTGLVARSLGLSIGARMEGEDFVIEALFADSGAGV